MGKANTKVVAEYSEFNAVKAVNKILNKKEPEGYQKTTPNFAAATGSDEAEVYSMEDDYGTSYFYRGNVTNNYVKFAGFYWRIIRINGDGSVRIRYDGTSAHANGENSSDRYISKSAFNENYTEVKYIGWMYGPADNEDGTIVTSTSKEKTQTNETSSTIKTAVDSWYKANIEDKGYGSAVADSIFCNDRSTPGSEKTGWSEDTGLGYGTNKTAYGAGARIGNYYNYEIKADIKPSFICHDKKDAFTVNDTEKGNNNLTYAVGLTTVDEIVAAGNGKFYTNNTTYYLYNPNAWSWSFSPYNFNKDANAYFIGSSGILNGRNVYDIGAVSPVINLSPDYFKTLIGEGTMESPFRAKGLEP